MSIYRVKRKYLDEEKYNACIVNSMQSSVYAYSWYLDLVAENWDVLVKDDYEAVMPLPWKKKYKVTYLSQPFFCQQLGVFSIETLSNFTIHSFWKAIPLYWWKRTYQFNSKNNLNVKRGFLKTNYVLDVTPSFQTILSNCNSNRKRDFKKSNKYQLQFIQPSKDEVLNFIESTPTDFVFTSIQNSVLKTIINSNRSEVVFYGVTYNDTLIAVLVALQTETTLTYLFPLHSSLAKSLGAPTFLILSIIKRFENSLRFFDFEGSMLEGVARFYKSFGAKKQTYYSLR